jgi:N-acetylglucosamine malate deacetylase 2
VAHRRPRPRRLLRPGLTVNGRPPPSLDLPPRARSALAVYAHPDDETFGLGAVLGALVDLGGRPDDLADMRAAELADAARVLGLRHCELLAYPDGQLAETPVAALAAHVVRVARRQGAELLVVFDDGGVTGHPDHQHATRVALAAAADLDVGVLAWAVPEPVAATLNAEHGTDFRGRSAAEIDLTIAVDRDRQRRAIACHHSQSTDNPVLRRRLQLTGPTEPLRWLRRPGYHLRPC